MTFGTDHDHVTLPLQGHSSEGLGEGARGKELGGRGRGRGGGGEGGGGEGREQYEHVQIFKIAFFVCR